MNKLVYQYNPFIKVYKENFKNKFLSRKNFHKILLQNAAMVILKNKKNKILFLNEYRRGIKKKTLGFPGGHIEKNETPLKCVKRELYEETNLKAKNWKLLFSYVRHGTYNCGKDYVFTADILEDRKRKIIDSSDIKWLNFKQISNKVKKNEFKTAGIIASILFYIHNE